MGTWGPGLFSDDDACDVRDDYREYVGDGLSGPEATDRLLAQWGTADDVDSSSSFWLALAATQWKLGRLESRVKERALGIINQGTDLKLWDDEPRARRRRAQVLEKLNDQLRSPQPPARKVRRVQNYQDSCEWHIGELISYELLSGHRIIFHVVDHQLGSPQVDILNWKGERIPSFLRLRFTRTLRVRRPDLRNYDGTSPSQLLIMRLTEKELPESRLDRLNLTMRTLEPSRPSLTTRWRLLDEHLKDWFNLE